MIRLTEVRDGADLNFVIKDKAWRFTENYLNHFEQITDYTWLFDLSEEYVCLDEVYDIWSIYWYGGNQRGRLLK